MMHRRIKASWLGIIALVVALILPGATFATLPPAHADTNASVNSDGTPNGDFTLTKTADQQTIPFGGAEVTYNYTIQNNSGVTLYLDSFEDDRCANLARTANDSMYQVWNRYAGRNLWALSAGGTSTWSCTQNITQTTTNTATLTMARDYRRTGFWPNYSYGWYMPSTATASETVTMTTPPDNYTCDHIWYSSDQYYRTYSGVAAMSPPTTGTVGTVDPANGGVSQVANIRTHTKPYTDNYNYYGLNSNRYFGSAAVAVDPLQPNYIYYTPRYTTSDGATFVFRYDTTTQQSVLLNRGDTYTGEQTVRLAANAAGMLYSIGGTGKLWRMDPRAASPRWQEVGQVQLPAGHGLAWGRQTSSGDIAFDGMGTLYYIASNQDTNTSYLLTISADELAKAQPQAKWVGVMGEPNFSFDGYSVTYNGIAFDSNGVLYASGSDGRSSRSVISKVDITTGSTYDHKRVSGTSISDLSSCSLPKPELRFTKVATPERFIHPGETLNWTVEVENIGTLAATNVTFRDTIQDATATSVTLNGGANLGADYFSQPKPVNSPGALPGVIAPGSKATVVISTQVPETILTDKLAEGGTAQLRLCNQAFLTATGTEGELASSDPNSGGIQDPTCISISGLTMQKTAPCLPDNKNPHPALFTIKVHNPGMEPIADVAVTDPQCDAAPARVTAASVGDAEAIEGDDDVLDPGETWYYQCGLTTNQAITNTAYATGLATEYEPDPATPENDGTVSATANATVELPGLSIEKTATTETGDQIVSPGEVITYTLTVKNDGPDQITQQGISLIDSLPQGVTYVPDSLTRTFWVTNGGVRQSFTDKPAVAVNAEGQLEIFARVQQPGELIALEPYNGALPEGEREQITVTFQATVDETIDLSTVQSLTNSAVATPEVTAVQCPVAGSVDNPLISKHSFTVRKRGDDCSNGDAVCDKQGAEFELYGAAASDPADPDAPAQMGDLIADGITPDSTTNGVSSATFTSAKLRPGRYWLVETKAPAGFTLLAEPIVFDLARDEATGATTITLVNEDDHEGVVSVTPQSTEGDVTTPPQIVVEDNAPVRLPQSGGQGVLLPLAAGLALVTGGLIAKSKKFFKGRQQSR